MSVVVDEELQQPGEREWVVPAEGRGEVVRDPGNALVSQLVRPRRPLLEERGIEECDDLCGQALDFVHRGLLDDVLLLNICLEHVGHSSLTNYSSLAGADTPARGR